MTDGFKKKALPPSCAIVFLALGVFLVFSSTRDKGFVNDDDNGLVYENP